MKRNNKKSGVAGKQRAVLQAKNERHNKMMSLELEKVALKEELTNAVIEGRQERLTLPRRSISVRIPEPMILSLDVMALERGITRSELMLIALDAYIPEYLK